MDVLIEKDNWSEKCCRKRKVEVKQTANFVLQEVERIVFDLVSNSTNNIISSAVLCQ